MVTLSQAATVVRLDFSILYFDVTYWAKVNKYITKLRSLIQEYFTRKTCIYHDPKFDSTNLKPLFNFLRRKQVSSKNSRKTI